MCVLGRILRELIDVAVITPQEIVALLEALFARE